MKSKPILVKNGIERENLFVLTIIWNFGPSASLSKHLIDTLVYQNMKGTFIEGLSLGTYKKDTI